MDFILNTVFLVMVLQYSDGQEIIGIGYSDIMDDICRYRFHASPLPWNQAHKVCEGMNRILAKIDNMEKLESVGNMATGNVSYRVPNANLSELWIGLRADKISNSVQHFWENCEGLSNSGEADSLWINDQDKSVEGCIAMNPNVKKFTAIDCSEARPYICETQATVPCYDKVDWYSELVFEHFSVSRRVVNVECGSFCLREDRCIAFQNHGSTCAMLAIHSHSSTGIHDLNLRSSAYTFGFIDLTSRQIDATAVSPSAPCTDTVTPSSASEQSSILTATHEGLEDTTFPSHILTATQKGHEDITFTSQIPQSTSPALESSEPSYMTSGQDNRLSASTQRTEPLNVPTPGNPGDIVVEITSTVDSSIVCPNGGMTPEMISKKIRQIAEDLDDDSGKRISIRNNDDNCRLVFSENVEQNHCAGDKTFPRGLELMSSINEMRKEIILSKLRKN